MSSIRKLRSLLLITILALTGCAASQVDTTDNDNRREKSISILFNVSSKTIDPHTDVNYTAVRAGIAETLVAIDNDLKLVPAVADSWSSEDGQVWTFHIRNNINFHNGELVDATAVKASLERAIELNPAVKNSLHIQSLTAKGQELTIETTIPYPQLPSDLVHPNTAILDQASDTDRPIGTGPFQLISFKSGSELQVERNSSYWGGEVKLAKAKFMFNEDANARLLAIQAKSADVVYRPPIESMNLLQTDPNVVVDSLPGLRTHQLLFNETNPHLQNRSVRQALDLLIDRDTIVSTIMSGQATAAEGPFLADAPFSPSYSPKKFDLNLARQAFESAGFEIKDGKVLLAGKPLSYTLLTYQSRPELPLIAQVVQANAKELGINIQIRQVDNIDEYLAAHKDWDLATYSMITAPRGDASYFLNAAYTANGALNYSKVQNAELQALIEKLNSTVSEVKRNELAKEANAIIDQEFYNSYVIHPNNVVAYQKHVKNWVTSKSEYYMLTKDLDTE